MTGFKLSTTLARSASRAAIAAAILAPGAVWAQTAPAPPTVSPQQGTPASPSITAPTPSQAAPEGGAIATNAQPDAPAQQVNNEIVVTGVRASLERSIAIKRNSFGVVDAISAEDIGKFPDTNLAESLQRITGVAIDRVNGEGAQVTVRGFGPGYNLVTLNGRTLASSFSQSVGNDDSADGAPAVFSRSFDFSNIASEGVKTLEVYKTGRAAVPSGGIGAAINVVTRHPLDTSTTGFTGSIGAKADYDQSASDCVSCGDKVTPDVTGYGSWQNEQRNFGVSLFAEYQKRDFSTVSATSNDWNIRTYGDFINPANGFVNGATQIKNAPNDPNALVSVPNDSRYHFSDDEYERFNTQAVVQFKPIESLTLTVDGLYVRNSEEERRSDQSNWFNRPFGQVTFSPGAVNTTTFLQENIAGVKDEDFEQQDRGQLNELQDYGFNAKWQAFDNLTLTFDGHYSKSAVSPNNPNGVSDTTFGLASNVVSAHSVDYSSGIPVEHITINDSIQGNGNGVLDIGDLGTNHARQFTTQQSQELQEYRFDGDWDLGEGAHFNFGVGYRDTNARDRLFATDETLGDWGVTDDGIVAQVAPGLVQNFCLTCKFNDFNPQATGVDAVAFRGDPTTLYNTIGKYYQGLGHTVNTNTDVTDHVEEKIASVYGQLTWKGELMGHKAGIVAGVRYEYTDTSAFTAQHNPSAIYWQADNDFNVAIDPGVSALTGHGHYGNILPSIDFQVNLRDDLIGRISASRTLARTDYNNLFAGFGVGAPPRPTALGGVASASIGNPGLLPLISNNFDVSLEWYYKKDSYLSIGFFEKQVDNFVGTGVSSTTTLGSTNTQLNDPSSGAAGTRSGAAKAELQRIGADITDVNLFTESALIYQNGNNINPATVAAATAQFQSHYNTTTRALDQAFVNSELAAVDLYGQAEDPLYNFSLSTPINNKSAQIYGFEFAGQHFFWDTGFGVSASYTHVDGDIGFNNAGDPNVNQFALTGLSDTASVTGIYDKHGVSARVSYNWRDSFLSALNRDSYRNPVYTKPYASLDASISYDITPHLAISLEAINLTNENLQTYGRDSTNLWFYQELQRRIQVGARYRF